MTWVSVHETAIGDKTGEVDLFMPISSRITAANRCFPRPSSVTVRSTLDLIAAAEKLERIDHLKLDIEGAELQALQGAPRTLALTRRILLEVHPHRLDPRTVLSFLTNQGFAPKILAQREDSWLVEALRR